MWRGDREKVSHVTVSEVWGRRENVSHVTVSGVWGRREKVSHVTVSGVWREEGKGVTCYGFWGIALLCLVLYMDSNLYPTIT